MSPLREMRRAGAIGSRSPDADLDAPPKAGDGEQGQGQRQVQGQPQIQMAGSASDGSIRDSHPRRRWWRRPVHPCRVHGFLRFVHEVSGGSWWAISGQGQAAQGPIASRPLTMV
ncbi:MAG: hypothetical protein DRJ61_10300 [Acidobacteria bacterium]|nr:MAG: hypothetical protein DRJ61_10300 [Acidobacteriota bacterium]